MNPFRTWVPAVLLAVALSSGSAAAYPLFASIAYSRSTGASGFAYNTPTAFQAQQAARTYCGAWDCQAVVTVANGCAALALGYGGFGTAYGPYRGMVMSNAVQACHWNAPGCRLHVWTCTAGH